MSDWIELKDLQAVAKAQTDGWEIEYIVDAGNYKYEKFKPWTTTAWFSAYEYRGRPKAERKVVRVRDAAMTYGVVTVSEEEAKTLSHKRSFLGWVKGSEWREAEYE